MAGFQLSINGRFWVSTEVDWDSDKPRMTAHEERVGSEDWMPQWARFGRLDEVRPTFDVFCLGKVLWAMLTGRERLPMRYDYDPAFVLTNKATDDSSLHWAEQILRRVIVDRESEMQIRSGNELLDAFDEGLRRLRLEAQRFSGRRSCRVCGIGVYEATSEVPWAQVALHTPGPYLLKLFRCSACGHIQHFVFNQHLVPPAWSE